MASDYYVPSVADDWEMSGPVAKPNLTTPTAEVEEAIGILRGAVEHARAYRRQMNVAQYVQHHEDDLAALALLERAALKPRNEEREALLEANATVRYVADEHGNIGAKMLVYLDQHGMQPSGDFLPPADSIFVNGWTKNPPADGARMHVTLAALSTDTEEATNAE